MGYKFSSDDELIALMAAPSEDDIEAGYLIDPSLISNIESPEIKLIWGILYRAALDATGEPGKGFVTKAEIEDARAWLSDRENTDSFSFLWCLEVLGIDPSRVKIKL